MDAMGLVFATFAASAALGVGGYLLAPKANQDVWRTSLILTIVCMWTM